MIALVVLFFGGIFISAIVDVAKNTDAFTTTTEAVTQALIDEFTTALENSTQNDIDIVPEESVTLINSENNAETVVTSTATTSATSNTTKPSTTEKTTQQSTTKQTTTNTAITTNAKVDLSKIPAFSNKPYVTVNNNQPGFSNADKTTSSFERYASLDSKGRCGVAYACIGKDLMPTGERGNIGSVKPSGWHTVKYAGIDGNYLYNRCHLIGWQLTGENANEKNLITGTRYMNVEGMLPFENMVADYIKETGNHVLYRVTPIFKGDNLLASGVQMEAYSVEDNGDGICFNVYCYNAQPGITINYADGSSSGPPMEQTTKKPTTTQKPTVAATQKPISSNVTYILNINPSSMKFHYPDCSSVGKMKEENKKEFYGTRDEAIAAGYSPCGNCHP
ncbi:MAG: DNA/RNA non-specific endonuclease [Clostridia bacterium]|nr:DNA/RNA non-specific endonuclease [Clostridia bacterium]